MILPPASRESVALRRDSARSCDRSLPWASAAADAHACSALLDLSEPQLEGRVDRRSRDVLAHRVVDGLEVREDEWRIAQRLLADLRVERLALGHVRRGGGLCDQLVDRGVLVAGRVDGGSA